MKSNAAFRQILEDVRKAPEKKPETNTVGSAAANGIKKKSQGSEKYRRLLEQKARQKEREDDESRYRDRADERRKEKGIEPESEIAALASVDVSGFRI